MASRASRDSQTERSSRFGRSNLLLLALALALVGLLAASGCTTQPKAATPEPAKTEPQPAQTAPSTPPQGQVTELKIEDTKVGTGAEAKTGDLVTVNYTGYLTDGTKFDSSLDSGQPFKFTIGKGEVIQGWDQGFAGMKVGGTRKLTIPPELGYGAQGAGGVIPPNAVLVFDVELLGVN
jgi:FKBP-type peptidyl-prolyl cis-trans isomerase